MSTTNPLLAPLQGDIHHEVGGVLVDVKACGNVRVKRMIYPPGFNWDKDLKAVVKTDHCQHAHVGFMAQGQINVRYADGEVQEFKTPCFVAVEPGHEGWVVGDEPAVLIEFDFETATVEKLGLPCMHTHSK